jgi:hypothetical protein
VEKIEIDIIHDILKSRLALHDFGIPVKNWINTEITKIKVPTLFIFSLRGANPMDYEFVNTSFNELIKAMIENADVFVAFKVDDGEFEELCTGIVDIMGYVIKGDLLASETLVKNQFSMMYINEKDVPMYIMPFDDLHKSILNAITIEKISSTKLQEKFNIIVEDLYRILENLQKSKFIIKVPGPEYIAVSHYI